MFLKVKLIFCLIFLALITKAQEYHKIAGILRSEIDSSAVAYAHVGIPAKGIGVISNINGEFELNIPASYTDSIEISHLSYSPLRFSIAELLAIDSVVYMPLGENNLDVVNVCPNDSILHWLEIAFSRIKDNCATSRNLSVGFFREVQLGARDNKNTRLTEIAIAVQDEKASASLNKIRIKPLALRKSDNDVDYSLFHKAMTLLFGEKNILSDMLTDNPIRAFRKRKSSSKDLFNRILNDTTCQLFIKEQFGTTAHKYVTISYDCPANFIGRAQGDITIDMTDFGILNVTKSLSNKGKSLNYNYEIRTKKIGEYYMPVLIRMYRPCDMRSSGLGLSQATLVFTEHYLDKKRFEKVRRKYSMKDDVDVYNYDMEYNPEFWKNYNILIKEPIAPKVIEDLEAKRKLESQFIENGKKGKR